jgi:hypothetical protein
MTKLHAQLIGNKAMLPREEFERLVELARRSEEIDIEMLEDDIPNFWKQEGEDIYSLEDGEPV